MNKALIILTALLLIPCSSFAQEEQQTALDQLLNKYETKQRVANASASPQDLESENRRLRSQIIDLRVEKDGLSEQVAYLQAVIDDMNSAVASEGELSVCANVECVPLDDVMNEKIITYVINSLGMYRIAELLDQVAPEENFEVHTQAQKIMNGVKTNLDALGFDTSDMSDVPGLDELLEELEIAQGSSRIAR